ncbi:MAG: hypothetical protein L6R40_002479 [Gallowayella cf. fulva]|nr:MAG: hypothetical protein L6R40_002479 [Xanthomendoza cf. fulva]
MAAFLQSVRQGFSNRQAGRANGANSNSAQQRSQNTSPVTASSPNSVTSPTGAPVSFPANPGANVEDSSLRANENSLAPEEIKWFFNEPQAKLGVKGNFMPLAAKPSYLDLGDWLAHQTVEQYRLICYFIVAIQETNHKTNTVVCNSTDCPTMSAGRHYTYTWLNNERKPIPVPACQYIALVQRWIVGKIHDPVAFPTDSPFGASTPSFENSYPTTVNTEQEGRRPIPAGPTTLSRSLSDLAGRDWVGKAAGFPDTFLNDVRTAWRQMFRIYAHLYHAHFMHPFWHIHSPNSSDLNSAFCYFVSVGKLFGLISDRDLEPMQALVDIWVSNGSIPADCANGAFAITQ